MGLRLLLTPALLIASCGGGTSEEPTAPQDPPPVPRAYEDAQRRLEALTRERLAVPQTDEVDTLVAESQRIATEAAEETVSIVRDFEEVVRENGERWRARCLVGIATANRALAVLIRNLDYALPRQVEAELRVLASEEPAAAAAARDQITSTIDEALEARARHLDENECVALSGALAALADHPDPDVDEEAIRTRMREIDACL